MNLYQEHILDHYKNPRNVGKIEDGLTAHEINPLCGDEITVYVKSEIRNLKSETNSKDKIQKIKYMARGCSITIASASILSDYLVDKKIGEIKKLTEDNVKSILNIDLTPARIKCAMLPLWAIKSALEEKHQKDIKNRS